MPTIALDATLSTLRNIAALTIRQAARLKPNDSLGDDLAFSDNKFSLFAVWQRQEGNRLRSDGKKTQISRAQVVSADTVHGQVALLLSRLGVDATDDEVDALIAEARGKLS